MLSADRVIELKNHGRRIYRAETGDPDLGPLTLLPGTWANLPGLPGRGWNSIALPFAGDPVNPLHYRLLVNQYNEELRFSLVDAAVPNRGIRRAAGHVAESDQFLVTLDYDQMITQIAADDFPKSGLAGAPGLPIHREPGLWLFMTNEVVDGNDIARLATVPHGDAVLALGTSSVSPGGPKIPVINGLPVGVVEKLENPYLAPYKHFHEHLFQGVFDPVNPTELLKEANQGVDIVRTTQLEVDSTTPTGGISNIPFIVKQANAASMKSTFWIQELAEKDRQGNPKLRLQYAQVVLLEFFSTRDGLPGRIRWPHVSINTMDKVVE